MFIKLGANKAFEFLVGTTIGIFLGWLFLSQNISETNFKIWKHFPQLNTSGAYQLLSSEMKILCMIMTHPANHKTKAVHVKNTWGKRCDKLLFITSKPDPDLDSILINLTKDSRKALRNKTRDAFLHVHDNYLNDFDWFMKADDDK